MTNDESELTRFRHGERVSANPPRCLSPDYDWVVETWAHAANFVTRYRSQTDVAQAERDAAPAAERRRIRSMLAGKIVETRREMRDGWSVPPEYMFDRIEILREIGKAVSK